MVMRDAGAPAQADAQGERERVLFESCPLPLWIRGDADRPNMPEMSGREAQERLRADPHTAAIPVIAASANAMPGEATAGLAAGYFRYLTKPFDVVDLLQAVGDGLAEARARMPR